MDEKRDGFGPIFKPYTPPTKTEKLRYGCGCCLLAVAVPVALVMFFVLAAALSGYSFGPL